jgi:hypothetical protein
LTLAGKACDSKVERGRVALAVESLGAFEKFMKMRRDLAAGDWATLAADAAAYRNLMIDLGEKHQPEFAFARMGWTGKETVNVRYFDAFYKATYDDAARVAAKFDVLTRPPLRTWKFRVDRDGKGEAAGWAKAEFDDAGWKATDVAVDNWSALGLHNFMGSAWYGTVVNLPGAAAGRKTYLWVGATDGRVKVFVNGKHVPYAGPGGKAAETFAGYCQPASFDITGAVRAGDNRVALWCTREAVNELGTGGLLAAPVVYRDR